MTIGEAVENNRNYGITKKPYTINNFTDLQDFLGYCEVNNWHAAYEMPRIVSGVADLPLAHNMYGIYDAHTNKGYVIDAGLVYGMTATSYIEKQITNCRAKYTNANNEVFDKALTDSFINWKDLMLKYDA